VNATHCQATCDEYLYVFSGRGDGVEEHLLAKGKQVWFAFFIGAICGGIAAAHYGLRCIIAPAIVLFVPGLLCWLIEAEKT
jgi:uncharacterized membrane protein YoaK (UPF0700 family)